MGSSQHEKRGNVPFDSKDDSFAQKFANIVNGPGLEGAEVIFVIVPANPHAEEKGSISIAFRAGLEVSHALRPTLTKHAHAMALQVRKGAASKDPLAALFENAVGIVREGSAVLISCSDRGLDGAAMSIRNSLRRLVSV